MALCARNMYDGQCLCLLVLCVYCSQRTGTTIHGIHALEGGGIHALEGGGIHALEGGGIHALEGGGIHALEGGG